MSFKIGPNKQYLVSPEGICKLVAILLGFSCWGLLYIGDVMANSNQTPDYNDQVLVCTAITITGLVLSALTYVLYSCSERNSAIIRFDAVLNIILCLASIACVVVTGCFKPFIWICDLVDGNDLLYVVSGECLPPNQEVLRNDGQNIAVVILSGFLIGIYAATGVFSFISSKKKDENSSIKGIPTSDEDL